MNAPMLRDRLPAIAPRRAERQSALIAALNKRSIDGFTTEAGTADADEAAGASGWIGLESPDGLRLALAPVLGGGTIPALHAVGGGLDAAAAAVALAEVEPLVAALERVLGVPLQPVTLEPSRTALDADDTVLRFDALQGGVLVHRVLVAVPGAMPLRLLAPLPLATAPDAAIKLAWSARVASPDVPAASLDRLARGDLLLLGPGPLLARLSLPAVGPGGGTGGGRQLLARLDMPGGSLVVEQQMDEPAVDSSTPPQPANDYNGATVATHVEIAGAGLTLEQIATLGIGSVVPVTGAAGGTLAVRVVAGERAVATGELIVVGDGFGVLVTSLIDER